MDGTRVPVHRQKTMMLIAFFDCEGVIHQTCMPKGETIDSTYNVEVLSRVHLQAKRPNKVEQGWMLDQDNACPPCQRGDSEVHHFQKH